VSSPVAPQISPFWTLSLASIGGRIGPTEDDFQVDEIPAYAPSGAGEHWYVRVEKRGMNTRDAALGLSRAARVSERDIGYAGMKDKHAVTAQWFSVPGSAPAPDTWPLPPGLQLKEISRHGNKLRTGHLRGNRFRIGLVDCEPGALENARALLDYLRTHGLVNYFGPQRFGQEGQNLSEALSWLRGETRLPRSRERFLSKLYPSVVQAEVFNRYATLRVELGVESLITGEVVRIENSSAHFLVEDVAREAPRYAAGEIRLTGPLPGPKLRPAAVGRSAELELQATRDAGVGEPELGALGSHAPGTRRDVLIFPSGATVETYDDRLVLGFELPAGSYATEVIRELSRSPVKSRHES
jgi:tRNA pseudouridine13 synthase